MVAPVSEDSRGIVNPAAGLRRFQLERIAPAPDIGRFVDRYWVVTWDLTGLGPHVQPVLAHPVVNVVLDGPDVTVTGVTTEVSMQTLTGTGRAFGIMFRPGGFRPLAAGPVAELTGHHGPAAALMGQRPIAHALSQIARTSADRSTGELVIAVEDVLRGGLPATPDPCEQTIAAAEEIARDPAGVSVGALASAAGWSVRQLQRRFANHVGAGPTAVIRRYRLLDAAERVQRTRPIDWAAVAAELRYSDQPHLIRDFRAAFGVPPARYARLCARSATTAPVTSTAASRPAPR